MGTINAYRAMQAEKAGHQAIYPSGGGVANASYGLPDLGITSLNDVIADVNDHQCESPPAARGYRYRMGRRFNIARTITAMEKAGAGAVHIEDQVSQKRCGHRPNKSIVSQAEMVDRIKAAADAKQDGDFVIMARTDALAVEGIDAAIERAIACVESGADAIFPEAILEIEHISSLPMLWTS